MSRTRRTILLLAAVLPASAASAEPGKLTLAVTEPAGIHRDNAPVHVLLRLPHAVKRSTPFRLSFNGMPVVAQFQPEYSGGESDRWWLDFLAQSRPRETRRYLIHYGPNVEPSEERRRGHELIKRKDAYVISNSPYIDWTVPRDFRGLLTSVNFRPSEHLRPSSPGLLLRDRDGKRYRLGGPGTQSRVIRHGRMAVALKFDGVIPDGRLQGVKWKADLVFPGPISWIDVQLQIEDARDRVAGLELQLELNLDPPTSGERTLVELGASRTIYRSLNGFSRVELRADATKPVPWTILRGTSKTLNPFVVAGADTAPAEGWAHVMDRKRCLAIAFDQFGRRGEDRITIRADGRLTASRTIAGRTSRHADEKRWRFWLHFVHFPPQQSAATDPAMMQSPLVVRQVQ